MSDVTKGLATPFKISRPGRHPPPNLTRAEKIPRSPPGENPTAPAGVGGARRPPPPAGGAPQTHQVGGGDRAAPPGPTWWGGEGWWGGGGLGGGGFVGGDCLMADEGVAHGCVPLHFVTVARAVFRLREVAALDQLADERVSAAFGDPDASRDVEQSAIGVAGYAQQGVAMFRDEGPAGHAWQCSGAGAMFLEPMLWQNTSWLS